MRETDHTQNQNVPRTRLMSKASLTLQKRTAELDSISTEYSYAGVCTVDESDRQIW